VVRRDFKVAQKIQLSRRRHVSIERSRKYRVSKFEIMTSILRWIIIALLSSRESVDFILATAPSRLTRSVEPDAEHVQRPEVARLRATDWQTIRSINAGVVVGVNGIAHRLSRFSSGRPGVCRQLQITRIAVRFLARVY